MYLSYTFPLFRIWCILVGCIFLGFVLGDSTPFSWSFQQPTYLVEKETLGLTEYTCDTSQTECRVNFDFTPSIPTEEPTTHYACVIDFGFGTTGEEAKCNPNTVIFPPGDHTVHLTITHKDTAVIVREGSIIIHNTASGPGGDTGGGTGDGGLVILPIYSADIQWQNSTDLLLKTDISLSEYTCDPAESECRINLLVTPKKDGNEDSGLTCLMTASFELLPSASDPCNPLQSIVPSGDQSITLQILQKSDSSVVATRIITLKNPLIDTSIDPLRVTSTLTWQSPTYLLSKEDLSLTEYTCDPEEIGCKMNLIVTPLLDGVESNELTCEIISDFEIIPTSDPCNPNTSLVPTGDHILTIKILQKSDASLLTTREIILKNPPIDTAINPTRITSSLAWQSPTYLLSKEDTSLTEYTCDPAQTECKINLFFTPLLDGGESLKLTCEITSDFPLESTTDPCNPNTSIVPTGDHILTLKILQKSDNSLLTTREILLKNPVRVTGGGSSGGGSRGSSLLDLSTVKMQIQSGLDPDGRCRSDMCQVNFLAEVPAGAVCHWNFGTGIFETAGTDTKCNPGYVKFSYNTNVTLTVSDPNNSANTVQKTLAVSREDSVVSPLSPQAQIDIQGILGKNKRLTSEGVTCAIGNDEICSLNFTGESSLNAETFFWNLGNGDTSDRENPGAIKYPLGRHRVVLRVMSASGISSEAYYEIEVVKKFDILPEKECLDCDKMRGKIQISAVLPNPPHADTVEWIEITNISSEQWDLSACTLSDTTKSFSLSEKVAAGKTLRLRQSTTDLSLGNTEESLELRCGEFLIDTFSWNFSIPSGYILRREMLDTPPARVSVVSVVDGDTLDVMWNSKKTRIRLLGVDTPETVHPLKSVEKFGKEASDFTKNTLTEKTIWITFDHELLDHYGRTLGYIWQCDDTFDAEKCQLFNSRLISEGYARMERRFEFMYYDDFDALEKGAKKQKIGIWSDPEVVKDLEKLSDEEAEKLKLEQEAEYLKLQQELLELARKLCEEEGICEDVPTWSDVTKKMTTFSVRMLVSGMLKVSGRTWGDFPVKITVFLGEDEVHSAQILSNTVGEYAFEWYPKVLGEYRIEATFVEAVGGTEILQLEKTLFIENISDHFLAPLVGTIVLQGTQGTKNRWRGEDRVFHCRSRGSCSVNLTAEVNRKKDIRYEWILPDGTISVEKNPPALKLAYGDYIAVLKITDEITGETVERVFKIQHRAIPKAPKKASSSSSKYTIDLKDATLDTGGGVMPEKSSVGIGGALLTIFLLSLSSFVLFGKQSKIFIDK